MDSESSAGLLVDSVLEANETFSKCVMDATLSFPFCECASRGRWMIAWPDRNDARGGSVCGQRGLSEREWFQLAVAALQSSRGGPARCAKTVGRIVPAHVSDLVRRQGTARGRR